MAMGRKREQRQNTTGFCTLRLDGRRKLSRKEIVGRKQMRPGMDKGPQLQQADERGRTEEDTVGKGKEKNKNLKKKSWIKPLQAWGKWGSWRPGFGYFCILAHSLRLSSATPSSVTKRKDKLTSTPHPEDTHAISKWTHKHICAQKPEHKLMQCMHVSKTNTHKDPHKHPAKQKHIILYLNYICMHAHQYSYRTG